jgi:hypothetical protein
MTPDTSDPRLEFDLEAMLDHVEAPIGLTAEERAELMEFKLVVNEQGADGNVQLACVLLSAMARIREDPGDKVGAGLHSIAEELARRILLVLA